jgi:hypothetical protein
MTTRSWFILAAIVACVAAGGWLSYKYEAPKVAAAKSDASSARAVTAAVQAARTVEHAVSASDAAASQAYQKGLDDGKTQLQTANDDLRTRIERLRQHSSTQPGHRVPGVSGSDSRCDAPGLAALSPGYRSAVIEAIGDFGRGQEQLASEADDQARQLTAAQKELSAR